MLISLLALAGIGVSVYLTLYKTGYLGALACKQGSCEAVQLSRWADFIGLPVAAWGLLFYLALFAVAFAGTLGRFESNALVSKLLLVLTAWGVLFSGWLTYLELFVIHAICVWCVGSAVIVTLAFIVSVLEYRAMRDSVALEAD